MKIELYNKHFHISAVLCLLITSCSDNDIKCHDMKEILDVKSVAYQNYGKWVLYFRKNESEAQVGQLLAGGCCTLRSIAKRARVSGIFTRPENEVYYHFVAHYKLPVEAAEVKNESIYVEADINKCGKFIEYKSMTYVSK